MSPTDSAPPDDFRRTVRRALLKGFAIPVLILGFFAAAPTWLDHNLHTSLAQAIARSQLSPSERQRQLDFYDRVDFGQVSLNPPPGLEQLRTDLHRQGIGGQFERLRWGWWLAVTLVIILIGVTVTTVALNRRAQRSPEELISAYRAAWHLGIAAALAQVLLLIPLLGYGSFEFMMLAMGGFAPKLIVVIVIAGVVTLWRASAILLRKVPLEFPAGMARSLEPTQAPTLWQQVRSAAERLGTEPPDHILVGMDHSFYVTELDVIHQGGRTTGRTLYLSLPLMQQLSPDEVRAIIGHELGHFRGADTRLTREFYPLRWKANATLHALAGAGWMGWTSVHALLFFQGSFARSEQAMSRSRELLADRVAADLTSPGVMASALIRVHVFTEAFFRRLGRTSDPNPFAARLTEFVRSELSPDEAFWKKLFSQTAAHPLDSHPTLRVRLEALGQSADPVQARATATAETATAHEQWLGECSVLFADIRAEAQDAVKAMRTTTADYATTEGRQLLDEQFPEIRWRTRALIVWLKLGVSGLGAVIGTMLLLTGDQGVLLLVGAALLLLSLGGAVIVWHRHHEGEFTLRADSIAYTGWRRSLRFEHIAQVSWQTNYGHLTAFFTLKTKAPTLWRLSPLHWIPTRRMRLELNLIPGKQQETFATIMRYLTRQTGP